MKKKNIVITGGISGFGRAIFDVFLKNDCKIIITSRSQNKIDKFKADMPEKFTNRVYVLKNNLENENDVDELLKFSNKIFNNKIDCVINNAVISITGKFNDIPFNEYKKAFILNFLLISYLIKKLTLNNNLNIIKVVNILGGSVHVGIPYSSSYSLTKLTLKVFTEILKMENSNLELILFHPGALNAGIENRKLYGFKDNPIKSLRQKDPNIIADRFYKDLCKGKTIIDYSKVQKILLLIYIFFPKIIKKILK